MAFQKYPEDLTDPMLGVAIAKAVFARVCHAHGRYVTFCPAELQEALDIHFECEVQPDRSVVLRTVQP